MEIGKKWSVLCTYKKCNQYFTTVKGMKIHFRKIHGKFLCKKYNCSRNVCFQGRCNEHFVQKNKTTHSHHEFCRKKHEPVTTEEEGSKRVLENALTDPVTTEEEGSKFHIEFQIFSITAASSRLHYGPMHYI